MISLSYMYILFIGQALWEVKMFDTVNRRKSDGQTPEHGYIISYSAQALMLSVSDVADVPP